MTTFYLGHASTFHFKNLHTSKNSDIQSGVGDSNGGSIGLVSFFLTYEKNPEIIRVRFLSGRRGRNRTHVKGFGDPCTTIVRRACIAREHFSLFVKTTKLQIARELYKPKRENQVAFPETVTTILMQFSLRGGERYNFTTHQQPANRMAKVLHLYGMRFHEVAPFVTFFKK